jgi:FAD:protein FMN transferase
VWKEKILCSMISVVNRYYYFPLIFLISFLFGCQEEKISVWQFQGKTMGTTYSIKVVPSKVASPKEIKLKKSALKIAIANELERINQIFSTYIEDSEVQKFNNSTSLDWVELSPLFFLAILNAKEVNIRTLGHFDPTIMPAINLWGFGPLKKAKVSAPSLADLEKIRSSVGLDKLEIHKRARQVRKSHSQISLDFSASAKGLAVDMLTSILKHKGFANFMVEVGGEVRALGTGKKNGWQIGIERPGFEQTKKSRLQKIVSLTGAAMATSGNYRNFFEVDGIQYQHILNPKTLKPVMLKLASVTVIDRNSCMNADAWATALMALGPIQGPVIATKNNISALFITEKTEESDEREIITGQFEDFLQKTK